MVTFAERLAVPCGFEPERGHSCPPGRQPACRSRIEYRGQECPRPCVLKNMNSAYEKTTFRVAASPEEAQGNCAVARPGGEQPAARTWSRTKVNSIQCIRLANLRAKGEACRATGASHPAQTLPMPERDRRVHGWSGNGFKSAWNKRRSRRGSLKRGGVRAVIVAMKPGNAGGAKGRRKVDAG